MSKLLASSKSMKGIMSLVDEFFYSKCFLRPCEPELWQVYNNRGRIEGFYIEKTTHGARYQFRKSNLDDLIS